MRTRTRCFVNKAPSALAHNTCTRSHITVVDVRAHASRWRPQKGNRNRRAIITCLWFELGNHHFKQKNRILNDTLIKQTGDFVVFNQTTLTYISGLESDMACVYVIYGGNEAPPFMRVWIILYALSRHTYTHTMESEQIFRVTLRSLGWKRIYYIF